MAAADAADITLYGLKGADVSSTDNPTVNLFDIIPEYTSEIDFGALERGFLEANRSCNMALLPPPFGFKGDLPRDTKIQIFLYPARPGVYYIVKHFVCSSKCKPILFKQGVYGQAQSYRWRSSDAKIGKKIIQYVLENLGGRWMTKNLKAPTSPIYQWPHSLVEKALRNIATDGALAKKEFAWPIPLTEKYYHKWLLDILEKIWNFDQSAFLMLGEAEAGKSPLGRSVLMAQVRHNQHRFKARGTPCIRCTAEIDFLRGEPGSVIMGDFLDDTTLSNLSVKTLKYFLDVGLYESMVWARWGATKWVQNEPRAAADNIYDEDKLPKDLDFVPSVPFAAFWDSIKSAFTSEASRAHADAILKRTAILLNSKTHVYYRPAGINQDPVQRFAINRAEYLTDAGKELFGKYLDGEREFAADFEDEVRREQTWVDRIMTRRKEERKPDFKKRKEVREALFGRENDVPREVHVKREFPAEEAAFFKKAKTWSHELRNTATGTIDLDSPERSTTAFSRISVNVSRVPIVPSTESVGIPSASSSAIPNAVMPELEEFIDTELAEEADFIEEMGDQMDIAGDEE
ncbi:unnamed protein product [Symbiodinium sp. KB8]|nr:unnamed protein product [Symbiodinium sp. KB8]